MDGTTFCPHCRTRFKIGGEQLEAHQGWVRCGHCLKSFDARIGFVVDDPSPQLELAILDNVIMPSHPTDEQEPMLDSLDFSDLPALPKPTVTETATDKRAPTLAEQVKIVSDIPDELPVKKRAWWGWLAVPLLLLLSTQAAYFFRADIAARWPQLKPEMEKYCELLACKITLPQRSDWMSIESSSLEADPNNAARITLNILLRNRADVVLAYPHFELTLNDAQDKPLARRVLKPVDYLPASAVEQMGLQASHELNLKLPLDTSELNPSGYRLLVFYPDNR